MPDIDTKDEIERIIAAHGLTGFRATMVRQCTDADEAERVAASYSGLTPRPRGSR